MIWGNETHLKITVYVVNVLQIEKVIIALFWQKEGDKSSKSELNVFQLTPVNMLNRREGTITHGNCRLVVSDPY